MTGDLILGPRGDGRVELGQLFEGLGRGTLVTDAGLDPEGLLERI